MILHRNKSKDRGGSPRKVTPPGPSFMSDEQVANYLTDLRSNRPTRPSGARPLPSRPQSTILLRDEVPPRAPSALSTRPGDSPEKTALTPGEMPPRCASAMSSYSHRRTDSTSSTSNARVGRPLVPEPEAYSVSRKVSPNPVINQNVRSPSGTYRESGQRWLEKQEARSLRDALQELDSKDGEKRLHDAARDEAAELVWKHRNPNAPENNPNNPYRNPDLSKSAQNLGNGSRKTSAEQNKYGDLGSGKPRRHSRRSMSSASSGSNTRTETSSVSAIINGYGDSVKESKETAEGSSEKEKGIKANFGMERRRTSSGSRSRVASNESAKPLFKNPADQIYEEPEEEKQETKPEIKKPEPASRSGLFANRTSPLKVSTRNALPWLNRGNRALPERSNTEPLPDSKKVSRYEIYKNPPTQSRNPLYTRNDVTPTPPGSSGNDSPKAETPPTKNGIEIRSDDIRAATSMRRSERSPNLPTPTAVSDRAGRPIVSFDPHWKPPAEKLKEEEDAVSRPSSRGSNSSLRSWQKPPVRASASTASAPVVPTINVNDNPNVPTINFPDTPIPSINLPDDSNVPQISVSGAPSVPSINLPSGEDQGLRSSVSAPAVPTVNSFQSSPNPARGSARPLPTPGQSSPTKHKTITNHWYSPHGRAGVPTASCSLCNLPISGRIVTANSSRFHPECFTCHHCHTGLECVAFYPEPDNKRAERLAETEQPNEEDHVPRFYCHLDFHEFFSPRCRSCKTPIEGEVIVACGGEWHVGHFFCAECGDPFDQNTPFIEKDSYAWCVSCHTKRTASRCAGCKKPVLNDITISALDAHWHADCFVCCECGGGFGDEGKFFVREMKEPLGGRKRAGMFRTVGKAVCVGCEGKRLKG